jgi:hypothetical protein
MTGKVARGLRHAIDSALGKNRSLVRAALRPALPLLRAVAWDREWFFTAERAGVHVTPVHFYSPIPDVGTLDDLTWKSSGELPGVDLHWEQQESLLRDAIASLIHQRVVRSDPRLESLFADVPSFNTVDSNLLYAIVRHFRPRRVVEVGAGHSTRVTAAALAENAAEGVAAEFTTIEPYPEPDLVQRVPGLSRLIQQPVQDVEPSVFLQLQRNDILFIDSSHTVNAGSDVNHLFLRILPRVAPGVLVHVHDIFLPAEYPESFIRGTAEQAPRFWNEHYMLHALLIGNRDLEVVVAGHALHLARPEALEAAIPGYDPRRHAPGSFWFRRVDA